MLSDGSDDFSVSSYNSRNTETFKFGNGLSRSRRNPDKRRIANRVSGAMSVVSLPDEGYSDSSSEFNKVTFDDPSA